MITITAKAILIAGLGFGDEGKGTLTDFFVREHDAAAVIRYNGGSQAAHNVITPDGRHHCFSQFGSGTFLPGVSTFLSHFTLVDPLAILLEAETLKRVGIRDALERLTIDRRCLVVTPIHKHLNRMLEISRGKERHGSCGKGVGQTAADGRTLGQMALRVGDLADGAVSHRKLAFLWRSKLDLAEQLLDQQPENENLISHFRRLNRPDYVPRLTEAYEQFSRSSGVKIVAEDHSCEILTADRTLVFEGAQGVLLDEVFGFWPHITHSNTTFSNAERLLDGTGRQALKLGVLRAYTTRHGAGPFVSENGWLAKQLPDRHNSKDDWQDDFRIGWPDLLALRYALKVCGGADRLALTNLDRLYGCGSLKLAVAYRYWDENRADLDHYFEWEGDGKEIIIRDIKLPAPNDREHQVGLTDKLRRCRPVYLDLPPLPTPTSAGPGLSAEAMSFILLLETALTTPISIVSVGPTAADKIKLKPCV